jgi:hypothetical protein
MRPVFPPLTIGPPSYDRRTRGLDRRIHSCKISIVDGPGSGLDRLKRSSFKKHQRWPERRRWAKDEQLTIKRPSYDRRGPPNFSHLNKPPPEIGKRRPGLLFCGSLWFADLTT